MDNHRQQIISELKQYFNVKELVCDHVYKKWGQCSWQFLPTFGLENLLVLRRDIIAKPMVCNTSELHQRGLRCNLCPVVKEKNDVYLSTHTFGIGWDFTVLGMTAEEARNLIKEKQMLLPHPARIERGTRWLHFDCLCQDGVSYHLHEFNG